VAEKKKRKEEEIPLATMGVLTNVSEGRGKVSVI
jgi:hypothetical protein